MAVRPLVTTGVALLSAGAIVAATPGLMTPPNIAIAASDAVVASKKSVTVSQLNLLGLSDIDINYLSDIFFGVDGYGGHVGSTYDPYYGGLYKPGPLYVKTGVDANGNPVYALARDENGNPLSIVSVDADGKPVVGDTPIYVDTGEAGDPTYVEVADPEFRPADPIGGQIYRDGLVGLAYYLSDQLLDEIASAGVPLISDAADFVYSYVSSYFYEAGIEETFRVVASELTGGINGPVSQALATAEDLSYNWLGYTGVLLTFAASGVPLAGPDLAAATNIFFFGGPLEDGGKEYNQGIDGIINYVVDRVIGTVTAPPSETEPDNAKSADTKGGGSAMLASAGKALPALDKLISIKLDVEDAKQPVEGTARVDYAASASEDSVETTATPATEASQLAETKSELSKLSNLKLKLNPATSVKEVKETAPEENSDETAPKSGEAEQKAGETDPKPGQADGNAGSTESSYTGTTRGAPNKFAPKSRNTERKKSAGEKFVEKATKNLEKAFKPKTKAGADEKAKADSDSGDKDKDKNDK